MACGCDDESEVRCACVGVTAVTLHGYGEARSVCFVGARYLTGRQSQGKSFTPSSNPQEKKKCCGVCGVVVATDNDHSNNECLFVVNPTLG